MFLRFVTTRVDRDSHKPQGVFQSVYELLNSGSLSAGEEQRTRETLAWFNRNLPTPPEKFNARRAIFWFRCSAHQSIDRIWELVYLLREHGHHVETYKCPYLANVCYRDDFQVAAYPSERDGRIRTS